MQNSVRPLVRGDSTVKRLEFFRARKRHDHLLHLVIAFIPLAFATGTGITASNLTVLSLTQLTVTFDTAANASLGGHQFRVTTPAGTSNGIYVDVLNIASGAAPCPRDVRIVNLAGTSNAVPFTVQ